MQYGSCTGLVKAFGWDVPGSEAGWDLRIISKLVHDVCVVTCSQQEVLRTLEDRLKIFVRLSSLRAGTVFLGSSNAWHGSSTALGLGTCHSAQGSCAFHIISSLSSTSMTSGVKVDTLRPSLELASSLGRL